MQHIDVQKMSRAEWFIENNLLVMARDRLA